MTETIDSNLEKRLKSAEQAIAKLTESNDGLIATVKELARFKQQLKFGKAFISNPSGAADITIQVSFAQTFEVPPVVVATAGEHPNDHLIVSVREITTTGFVGWIRRSNNSGWSAPSHVYWVAISN